MEGGRGRTGKSHGQDLQAASPPGPRVDSAGHAAALLTGLLTPVLAVVSDVQ